MQRLSLQLLLRCQLSIVCCISQGRHSWAQQGKKLLEATASSMCSTGRAQSLRSQLEFYLQHISSTCCRAHMLQGTSNVAGGTHEGPVASKLRTDLHPLDPVQNAQ